MLKSLVAVGVLVVVGVVGVVVHHEIGKRSATSVPKTTVDEAAEVATVSTGQEVDVAAHVPSEGLTLVGFTADLRGVPGDGASVGGPLTAIIPRSRSAASTSRSGDHR